MRAVMTSPRAVASKTAQAPARPAFHDWDDSRVVAEYLAGSMRAFDELVGRYQKRLLNFIYRTIGDRERAEDLVQEVSRLLGLLEVGAIVRVQELLPVLCSSLFHILI